MHPGHVLNWERLVQSNVPWCDEAILTITAAGLREVVSDSSPLYMEDAVSFYDSSKKMGEHGSISGLIGRTEIEITLESIRQAFGLGTKTVPEPKISLE